MVRENRCFLRCAASMECRPQFFKSPFVLTQSDRDLLKDEGKRDQLMAAIRKFQVPVFTVNYQPQHADAPVDNFVRNDQYILRLALLIYSIRVKILAGTKAEEFYWLNSTEVARFIERLDEEQTIDALIKGVLTIKPVLALEELLAGELSSIFGEDKKHMRLPAYLQIRFENWSHGQ